MREKGATYDSITIAYSCDNPLIFDNPGTAPDIVKLSEDDEWVYYAITYTGGAPDNYAGFLKIIKIHKEQQRIK